MFYKNNDYVCSLDSGALRLAERHFGVPGEVWN